MKSKKFVILAYINGVNFHKQKKGVNNNGNNRNKIKTNTKDGVFR